MRHDAPIPAPARILLVEDEMMVSMLMEDALTDAGYQVRTVGRLGKALELAKTETFDAALLDLNLNGERSFPVAALLHEHKVPFAFSSGYSNADREIPSEYSHCPMLQKPFGLDQLWGPCADCSMALQLELVPLHHPSPANNGLLWIWATRLMAFQVLLHSLRREHATCKRLARSRCYAIRVRGRGWP